ncbi:serine hydrolase [Labrenzia sp. DG1229]|uniref:serine hydrolase n=1 Tax=Labrenzia sp. DG1229 TaxID=681847 RepID=UPI00048D2861|nr:serine hydrolase [Labrenzia sp. DG1229]
MSFALPDKLEKLIAPYQGNSSIAVTGFLHGDHNVYSLFGDPADTPGCAPEDLIFEIGSISKVFTALLLALLTEQGKIDPDRPIRDLCEEFSCAPPQLTPFEPGNAHVRIAAPAYSDLEGDDPRRRR